MNVAVKVQNSLYFLPNVLTLRMSFLSSKFAAQSQEINSLEDTVAALKDDYEKSLSVNAASQKDLQENLVSAKHDLLRVQEQLTLAEKVRHHHCGPHPQGTES